VPSLCPTDPGTTLAPSSPDMDDGSSKRQATRVFKKSSPNGKITVYLGKRDFVDHIDHVDPIGTWGVSEGLFRLVGLHKIRLLNQIHKFV
jgi:hypothetical protein